MSAPGLLVLATTFPDRPQAEAAARRLVDAGLVVCAQVGADLVSFYRWQGQVQRDQEVALVLKVLPDRYDLCAGELKQLHPYDVPQITAWPCGRVDPDYLAWARGERKEQP